MTRIFLIRHAEAEGNHYRRVQGWYDGRITGRGYLQIEALAERFRDIRIDALYSSDLRRTRETAGAILKYHDLLLNTDERLREVNLGVWEDTPWGNAAFDYPHQMLMFGTDPENCHVPGGEDYRHLQDRMAAALTEIASRHDGETVAVFSHGAAIRSLLSYVKKIPSPRISEIPHGDNTCVALLVFDNATFNVEYYNDNSHLLSEISTFAGQRWWETEKKGADLASLRLVPMNLDIDAKVYMDSYADSWKNAHGSLLGFRAETYLKNAKSVVNKNPHCLMKAYSGASEYAGIVELDQKRAERSGAGWISFFYLMPQFRGKCLAPQLLGHAVSFSRSLGRDKLRLHVSESNEQAIRFYEREGFKKIGMDKGVSSQLFLMEKPI